MLDASGLGVCNTRPAEIPKPVFRPREDRTRSVRCDVVKHHALNEDAHSTGGGKGIATSGGEILDLRRSVSLQYPTGSTEVCACFCGVRSRFLRESPENPVVHERRCCRHCIIASWGFHGLPLTRDDRAAVTDTVAVTVKSKKTRLFAYKMEAMRSQRTIFCSFNHCSSRPCTIIGVQNHNILDLRRSTAH